VRANQDLVDRINQLLAIKMLGKSKRPDVRIELRQILTTRLSESELCDFCFDLDVDYDSLPGEGKANKARELIAHLDHRNRIPELIETGRRLRGDIPWPEVTS